MDIGTQNGDKELIGIAHGLTGGLVNMENKLKKMALEMIFQMTGERVPKKEQCEIQGNANYQIAMYYLRKASKINEKEIKFPLPTSVRDGY